MPEKPQGQGGADLKALQKDHYLFDLFVLFIASLNKSRLFGADTRHFLEAVGSFFYHLQRLQAKILDQQMCRMGPHALDKAGSKEPFQTLAGCGHNGLPLLDLKLPAVAGVNLPLALEPQVFALVQRGEIPYKGNLPLAFSLQPSDHV